MFSDHMVLCHDRENPVWGDALPGAAVRVRLGADTAETVADAHGHWQVQIPTPPAGTITTMRVECGDEQLCFEDVASGEVWLAGGQSNMEMPVMCADGGAEIACVDAFPEVRMLTVPRRCRAQPQLGWHFCALDGKETGWTLPSRDAVALFSAVGYCFGAMLSRSLKMPVGIINCNWGGTKIQCWMPEQELLAQPDTREDLRLYQERRAALGAEAETSFRAYQQSVASIAAENPGYIDQNLADPLAYLQDDRKVCFPPEGSDGDPQAPACLYEHMIARTAPYGLRGVLWYQGESNAFRGEADRYAGLFARMIRCWRRAWRDEKLPFLTCQLAAFDPSRWGDNFDWPALRRQQSLCERLPYVSMAVLADLGDKTNIHPLRKRPVAQRLHDLAMEDVYGVPSDAHSPALAEWSRIPNGARLRFDRPVAVETGDLPVIAGVSGALPCRVKQVDLCTLECVADLPDAASLQYGQAAWFVPSLFGVNGLPVAPFELAL